MQVHYLIRAFGGVFKRRDAYCGTVCGQYGIFGAEVIELAEYTSFKLQVLGDIDNLLQPSLLNRSKIVMISACEFATFLENG